jgi:hypothetical protein
MRWLKWALGRDLTWRDWPGVLGMWAADALILLCVGIGFAWLIGWKF